MILFNFRNEHDDCELSLHRTSEGYVIELRYLAPEIGGKDLTEPYGTLLEAKQRFLELAGDEFDSLIADGSF